MIMRPTNEDIRRQSMKHIGDLVAVTCGCQRCLTPKEYRHTLKPCPRNMSGD